MLSVLLIMTLLNNYKFSCAGRFGLEPGGTSCTIDYWHGNFRNYNYFVLFLVIFAYIIPITAM